MSLILRDDLSLKITYFLFIVLSKTPKKLKLFKFKNGILFLKQFFFIFYNLVIVRGNFLSLFRKTF